MAGVVDVAATDDADAVATAKQVLALFGDRLAQWTAADQEQLREVVPANRRRAYDVRTAVTMIADRGSVVELRPRFARGMVTALAHLDGRAIGIIANNPLHLAGAITSDGADKAARFLQLCDAYDLPILSLCDTRGIMVGPAAEQTGLVRHAARLFTVAATMTVPVVTVIRRKGYGLGTRSSSRLLTLAVMRCRRRRTTRSTTSSTLQIHGLGWSPCLADGERRRATADGASLILGDARVPVPDRGLTEGGQRP